VLLLLLPPHDPNHSVDVPRTKISPKHPDPAQRAPVRAGDEDDPEQSWQQRRIEGSGSVLEGRACALVGAVVVMFTVTAVD
jgi:hypothetical protein